MMPAAASAMAARNTSRGWTSELLRIPRVISRSPRIWLWLPNARTWNSSTVRSRSRAAYTRCTSVGPRIRSGGGSASAPTRRPSSNAAASRAALLRPTPGTRANSASGRPPSRRSDPSTRASSSPATTSASRPAQPVPRRIAKSSCPVSAAGPTAQSRSRGRSCSGCSARRSGMGEHRWGREISGYPNNSEGGTRNAEHQGQPYRAGLRSAVPRSDLRRRPVTLLELLAAAAGTRIVAAYTRVGVAGEGRLGHGGPRRTHGRGLARRDQAIGRGLGRHDRRRAAPAPRLPPCRPGQGARRRAQRAGGTRGAAGDRDLDRHVAPPVLEPPLRKRVLDVAHQPLEHVERFGLVLDEGVLLPPGAVVDALA